MKIEQLRIFNKATAIITGGASGIGRALAEELAKRGCEVILADLQIELAEEVALKIRATGGLAKAYKLDVADFSSVAGIVKDTVKHTGRLDFMFNNAGISITGPAYLFSIEDWNRTIDVNLRGVANGVYAAYQVMLKQGFGHIVNTASMAGLTPMGGIIAYAATKHAIVGLSISLRAEAAIEGIRVSVICPGAVKTPILVKGGKYGKSYTNISLEREQAFWDKQKPMHADIFAKKVLHKIAKNEAVIIEPSWNKLLWLGYRLFPTLGIFATKKMYQAGVKKFSD